MDNKKEIQAFIKAFGQKVNYVREQKKCTLDDLEFYSNIDSSDLNKIELGKSNITMRTLFRLAKALGVHPKELFDFEMNGEHKGNKK